MAQPWTEADIPDQSGRTVLVTGANSGIGYEAARALAEKGAHVVLACRSGAKAERAADRISDLSPKGTTEILDLDLADLESVAEAAAGFSAGHDRLDVLVNNAGLMATPEQRTAQGFEMQFGVNHLGHFALTGHLLPLLLDADDSRIVTISSGGHRAGRIHFDDLQFERRYRPWNAYFQSKLANLLFTYELQRRLGASSSPAVAVAAHPGGAQSNLGHESPGGPFGGIMQFFRPVVERVLLQSAASGALPTLRAATDPDVQGGDYYGPSGFMEQHGHPVKVDSSGRSKDPKTASRLWTVSEELTGVSFDGLA